MVEPLVNSERDHIAVSCVFPGCLETRDKNEELFTSIDCYR